MKKAEKDLVRQMEEQMKERKSLELGLRTKYAEPQGAAEVRTAIALERVGPYFCTVEYKIQGDRVLEVIADEPNVRAVAADCFKIKAQKTFLD